VGEGDVLTIEKLPVERGKKVEFNDVLLMVDEEKVAVGQPLVKGVRVEGEVLEGFRGPKIRVAKFKAKSRYRRVMGYRQDLTRVRIKKIIGVREGKKSDQRKNQETES
jgi:large subunit ribosomal protein L21